jgi:SAM-dependent methyltransferase
MDIKEQDILGDAIGQHWYYRAKGAAMRSLLGEKPVRHVLDVGAGSGVFSRLLLDHGATEATCVDPGYPTEHTEQQGGKPIRFVHGVTHTDADTVLLMDVLEHVDDDTALLRDYVQCTPPNARFLITVPAFQWMWSGHDVFLEHRRRYTLPQLENVVRSAGLKPVAGCYYYALPLPLAWARRKLTAQKAGPPASDLKMHSPLVNAVLYAVCAFERAFFKVNRVAGLTVFCLAERGK